MTTKRRAIFRPVTRETTPSEHNGTTGGGKRGPREEEPHTTRLLRAALSMRPLHIALVPAKTGENNIDEKDQLEHPVLRTFIAAHTRTTHDSPDFHAINQARPPIIGIAMAAQDLRGDTMPTILADIFESGMPTTYGTDHRFPLQDMSGYEILATATGPREKRNIAVTFLREVADAYNANATDVLYHADTDASPTDPVTVTLVFELPEPELDRIAPGLRESPEYRTWYAPYTK